MQMGSIKLMPHQVEALEKFTSVQSVIVGDDTGTGKTVTTIALIEQMRKLGEVGPCLIISKSFDVWTQHLELMGVDSSRIHVIDKKNRTRFVNDLLALSKVPFPSTDYYIMHWEALPLIEGDLFRVRWLCIMGDEAHKAKNRKAARTKVLKRLRTTYKIAVTATPGDNLNQDVWSILNWLYPKKYTSYWRWVDEYIEYETHWKGYKIFSGPKKDKIPDFLADIESFYIARPLSVVDDSIPEYAYSTILVDMLPDQAERYKSIAKIQIAELSNGMLIAPSQLLEKQRLQQIAMSNTAIEVRWKWVWRKNHITGEEIRVKEPYDSVRLIEPSPKLDALDRMMTGRPFECVDEETGLVVVREIPKDEPLVIFSTFRDMVDMAAARMDEAGISYVSVKGGAGEMSPDEAAKIFQAGDVRVFMGTVETVGESVTLIRAHIVTFIDRHWSPRVNKQAQGRIRRIGQLRTPWIIDIKTRDTVDQIRLDRVRTKQGWQNAFFGKDWD